MTKEEIDKIADAVLERVKAVIPMSKVQAYTYLNMRRSNFDRYIREGLLPKGKDLVGFKEKVWYRIDLDKAIKQLKKYGYNFD